MKSDSYDIIGDIHGEPLEDAAVLNSYYRVSEFIDPLPPGPMLNSIWDASFQAAEREAKAIKDDERDLELDAVQDWLELATTISNNEPRFLRQISFPSAFETFAGQLVGKLRARLELCIEFDDADDCSSEETRMDQIRAVGLQFAELFENALGEQIARRASDREEEVRDRRRELEKEDERSSSHSSSDPLKKNVSLLDDAIDLERLFNDL